MRKLCLSVLAAMGLCLGAGQVVQASDTPVILTVTLPADESDQPEIHRLTLADMQAMPEARIETTTIWTTGPQVFAGVWLATLLDQYGIDSGELELHAINDYHITLAADEIAHGGALIAYHRNGAPMTARENGPLWLVYDYDSRPEFRSETYYARSIWQLDRIFVSR